MRELAAQVAASADQPGPRSILATTLTSLADFYGGHVEDALDLLGSTGDVRVEGLGPVDLDHVDGDELEPVLLQARDVGAAIVDETIERGADLLVVGLPYRKRFGGEFAIGRTIPYVLQSAPCAVWVVREPMTEEPS